MAEATEQAGTGATGPYGGQVGHTVPGHRLQPTLGGPARAHHREGSHGQDQPQPTSPRWIGHLGLMPAPAAPLAVFKPGLDPRPHPIPGDLCDLRRQIGQDQPGIGVRFRPLGEQGAR